MEARYGWLHVLRYLALAEYRCGCNGNWIEHDTISFDGERRKIKWFCPVIQLKITSLTTASNKNHVLRTRDSDALLMMSGKHALICILLRLNFIISDKTCSWKCNYHAEPRATVQTHFLHIQLGKQVSTHILCSPNVHENTHTQTVMLAHWLPALIECLSWQMDCWNHTCNAPLGSSLPFIHQGLFSASMCVLSCVPMCEDDRVGESFLMSASASVHSLWVVSLKGFAMVTFHLVQPSNTEDTAMWINDSKMSLMLCAFFAK